MTVPAETIADGWAQQFQELANQDKELQAHGKYYTCSFLLDTGERSYLIRVNRGRVEEIVADPGPLDERYQFAIRASADTWRKFSQPTPEPMYHGIFAASFQKDMRLEGDLLALMQNLRCVVRHLELMRLIGAPA
jgi:hypothetical protein